MFCARGAAFFIVRFCSYFLGGLSSADEVRFFYSTNLVRYIGPLYWGEDHGGTGRSFNDACVPFWVVSYGFVIFYVAFVPFEFRLQGGLSHVVARTYLFVVFIGRFCSVLGFPGYDIGAVRFIYVLTCSCDAVFVRCQIYWLAVANCVDQVGGLIDLSMAYFTLVYSSSMGYVRSV